jgi:hypothetical protein
MFASQWWIADIPWRRVAGTDACAVTGSGRTPEHWAELALEQDYISVCPSG